MPKGGYYYSVGGDRNTKGRGDHSEGTGQNAARFVNKIMAGMSKKILVFKNGDAFDDGTHMVVTNRAYRNFDVLLDDMSRKVKLPNGAVRHLYTPTRGHEVFSLDALKNNSEYVCSSVGRFKKRKYGKMDIIPWFNARHVVSPLDRNKVLLPILAKKQEATDNHSRKIKNVDIPHGRTIAVFKNGQQYDKAIKYILNRHTAQTFEQVLNDIGATVKLARGGGVRKLYTIRGKKILCLADLLKGDPFVVACGPEKFQNLPYLIEETIGLGPKIHEAQDVLGFEPFQKYRPLPAKENKGRSSKVDWFKTVSKNRKAKKTDTYSLNCSDSDGEDNGEEESLTQQPSKETLFELFADNDNQQKKDKAKSKFLNKYEVLSSSSNNSVIFEESLEVNGRTSIALKKDLSERRENNHPQICIDSPVEDEHVSTDSIHSLAAQDIISVQEKRAEAALKERKRQEDIRRKKLLERSERRKKTDQNAENIIENHETAMSEFKDKLQEERERQRAILKERIKKRKESPKKEDEEKDRKVEEKVNKSVTPNPEKKETVDVFDAELPSPSNKNPTGSFVLPCKEEDFPYAIEEKIGTGNFADVRKCSHKLSGKTYAIKIIDKSKAHSSTYKENMFEMELEILKEIEHPNMIKLYDHYETERYLYLVTELASDGDLFDRVVSKKKRKALSEKDASHLIKQLVLGVEYLHRQNVVHRDLKPENILIDSGSDGKDIVKVCDFGLATTISKGQKLGTVCGTPTYVAPEILSEEGYDEKVDIWAIGVITYILLCGHPPFHSKVQKMLFQKIRKGEYDFHEKYWGCISSSAKELIKHMLTVDPKERFTASQVLEHPWIRYPDAVIAAQQALPEEVSKRIMKYFDPKKKYKHLLQDDRASSVMSVGTKDGGKFTIDSRIHSMAVSAKKLNANTSGLASVPDVRFISASSIGGNASITQSKPTASNNSDVVRSDCLENGDEKPEASRASSVLQDQLDNDDLISIGEFTDRPTFA
eukprot:Nk52_evm16s343 gene=Nk52_evmTU16s343